MLRWNPRYSHSRLMVRFAGGALVVALPGLFIAQPGLAQDVTASVAPGPPAAAGLTADDAEQALRDRQADDLVLTARDLVAGQSWAEAASLYEQAAELRAPFDLRAIDEFSEAANLYAFGDDARKSVTMLEAAGERAQEIGEDFRAATAFQQAAVLNAQTGGVRYKTTTLWEKVCDLSESPALTDDQRDALIRKVPICR